jgi:hypothetical protein
MLMLFGPDWCMIQGYGETEIQKTALNRQIGH